ncbi:MAG: hypothetical protein HY786_06640 [Deltaproteobacteria bacterium]|nr:hypothetical protein [Deltaproteobacteria bacterium]
MHITLFDVFKDGSKDAVAHPYVIGLFGLDIGHEPGRFLFGKVCALFGPFEIKEVFQVCM